MPRAALVMVVEIMNIGANYLREHMKPEDRIHYVITDGGSAPNIVPDQALVWYHIRYKSNESVLDLTRRVKKIAEGAALITDRELIKNVQLAFEDEKAGQIYKCPLDFCKKLNRRKQYKI